ncbi:class I SAM-dependent methyltransferase [Herbaspirillum sp. HC18]|nr:class I SAM-dependent methyltransferase [Herbaspirillum sp. HC18]
MSINHVRAYNQAIRDWLLKVFSFASAIPKDRLVVRVCPVCGSGKHAFYANNDHLDYVRCNDCTLIFMNPAPDPAAVDKGFEGEDALLMEYFTIIRTYRSDPSPKPDPEADNKLKDIHAVKRNGRLLDVGCSTGEFLRKASYFYDVEGVEVNPHTAAVAKQHFTVHQGFLHNLCMPPVYDVVTLHQILYGVPDPVGLLCDIRRVLKDDGILYVNTPNADSYAMSLYGGKANHLYGYTTLNVFNRNSLAELAARAGFEIAAFRTEWLDIYVTDVAEFYDHPERFIHKRNCHLPDYEARIREEDNLHRTLNLDLGMKGNYLVAVLRKTGGALAEDA